jgi:hypothetical protein
MPNKEIFGINIAEDLPLDEYAASLGLASTPLQRFWGNWIREMNIARKRIKTTNQSGWRLKLKNWNEKLTKLELKVKG